MTPSVILTLVAQFGPQIIGLVGKLVALKNAGDKPLTETDFLLLEKLASKTSADYLAEAEKTP
jgi:hypothetical protein